jgi:S-adenosylmethionine:tRNA ribosyltransferase-isomerase
MTASLKPRLSPAIAPIESTGRERHDVALLVASAGRTVDTRFDRIGEHLEPGDVLVVNTSATEPAALNGRHEGAAIDVHVSGPAPGGGWLVELRLPDRSGPILSGSRCDRIDLEHGSLTLIEPVGTAESGVRLWNAEWRGPRGLTETLRTAGRPIRYSYVPDRWPLDTYRTVFEVHRPGFSSAEMPSAGRPFTRQVVQDLARRGVEIAAITLHTGVSSPESHEAPMPERFEVNGSVAEAVNRARARGGRVVAVGTTSVRAIESAVRFGSVVPARGWTDLVLSPDRPTAVVDGLVTGWHPPEASHLDLIEAIVGAGLVSNAYRTAHALEYRSHEFGDSCLLLRD